MPGSISTVAVKAGQPVKAGDVLLTIEAMKMETALRAPRDATTWCAPWSFGSAPVDAKDLLAVLATPAVGPKVACPGSQAQRERLRRYTSEPGTVIILRADVLTR